MKPTDKQRLDWLDKRMEHVGPFKTEPPEPVVSFFSIGAKGKCSVRQAIDRAMRATEPKRGKK